MTITGPDYERKIPVLHVAAMPTENGSQSCQRCGEILHKARTGADPPWYPGQVVSKGENYCASMRYEPEGWPRCVPVPR